MGNRVGMDGRCLIDFAKAQQKGEFSFECVLKDKSTKNFALKDLNGKLALIEQINQKKGH